MVAPLAPEVRALLAAVREYHAAPSAAPGAQAALERAVATVAAAARARAAPAGGATRGPYPVALVAALVLSLFFGVALAHLGVL
jgi:hypothetical protein